MVFFDVESLFTNLPLNECFDLNIKYFSEGNPGLKPSANELKVAYYSFSETQLRALRN